MDKYAGEVFVVDVLVAAEGVGVGVVGVELDGPVEEGQTILMFLLEGETVAHCYPTLLCEDTLGQTVVGQVGEFHLFLQVP